MARFMLAWELGANIGHVVRLHTLAKILNERGHACVFAACDLRPAEETGIPLLGAVLQAPLALGKPRNPVEVQISYASLLNNSGFDDVLGLTARLRAWRQLLSQSRCDYLIADHAPTALLAARTLEIPCLHIGTGFSLPPVQSPFPAYPDAPPHAPEVLHRNEQAVLSNINRALEKLGCLPLRQMAYTLAHAHHGLLTYAELDHYQAPRQEPYLGIPLGPVGAAAEWPDGRGPRLLAYLRPGQSLPAVLTALQRSRAQVLLRIGDVPLSSIQPYLRAGMNVTDRMLDMPTALQECDAYLSYGSHGFVAEALLAGKPGLLLPDVQERQLLSQRVQQMGAALVPPRTGNFNLSQSLDQILEDGSLCKSALAFSERYRHLDRNHILPQLVDQILSPAKPGPAGTLSAAPAG